MFTSYRCLINSLILLIFVFLLSSYSGFITNINNEKIISQKLSIIEVRIGEIENNLVTLKDEISTFEQDITMNEKIISQTNSECEDLMNDFKNLNNQIDTIFITLDRIGEEIKE